MFFIDFSEAIPFLRIPDIPIFVFRDASYLQLNELNYPGFENFNASELRDIEEVEKLAFNSCDKVLLTSNWSIDYCLKYYPEIKKEKYFTLPFCSQVYPPVEKDDWSLRQINLDSELKFLFVGRDWNRKGGPKTLEILNELHERGIRVSLDVVGAKVDNITVPYKIEIIENLDFSNRNDLNRMKSLYKKSHFFILPINLEAFGIVFLEAMSFGLPIITHNICAIPEILENNVHGISLKYESSAKDFSDQIFSLINSPDKYLQMQNNCFEQIKLKFHPKIWIDNLISLL